MRGTNGPWTSLIALLVVAGVPACATHETPDEPKQLEGQYAELLGCSGYAAPDASINAVNMVSVPVRVTVTPSGAVEKAFVPRTGVPTWAKRKALNIVRTCQFQPAMEDGETVESRTTIDFNFRTASAY